MHTTLVALTSYEANDIVANWMNGMMTGVVLKSVVWHEDYERMCCTSVSSFSFESPERVNANLDTGVTLDTFLAEFDRHIPREF